MTDDRAVPGDKHRGIRTFLWQYDNKHISTFQDVGGDENWRLCQTDIASKQTMGASFLSRSALIAIPDLSAVSPTFTRDLNALDL